MKNKLINSFAAVAGLAMTLGVGTVHALPDRDQRSPGYDHFEETIGAFVQADACLAGGKHNASIAIPFLYSVTDFSRQYPEDYKRLDALMQTKYAQLQESQKNPQSHSALMATMRTNHAAKFEAALGKDSNAFWNTMEQHAQNPMPPSMPFTFSFQNVLKQKGADYVQKLTVDNNVLPILQQMDNVWHKQRRQVFTRGDEAIMKNLATQFAPALKDSIAHFYSADVAAAIVDESFGRVITGLDDFAQGSDVFYTTLSKKFGVTDETALLAAQQLDAEWANKVRANTPMEQAELNNFYNELLTEETNAAIQKRVPSQKVVEVMATLWAQHAANLSPTDMDVEQVQDSPKLLAAMKEIVQALQVTVEARTGISVYVPKNVAHTPAKPGCAGPQ